MSDTHAHHFTGRVEDRRLVTGTGKYAADWSLPGQLYACFVRSDRAHAGIVSVNAEAAMKHDDVVITEATIRAQREERAFRSSEGADFEQQFVECGRGSTHWPSWMAASR